MNGKHINNQGNDFSLNKAVLLPQKLCIEASKDDQRWDEYEAYIKRYYSIYVAEFLRDISWIGLSLAINGDDLIANKDYQIY